MTRFLDFIQLPNLSFLDHSGYFTEFPGFIEGSTYECEIGVSGVNIITGQRNLENSFNLKNNFVLRSLTGTKFDHTNALLGEISLQMTSPIEIQDHIKSASYNVTLSEIAKTIANQYNLTSIITPTINSPPFYQTNDEDSTMLHKHARFAYSNSFPKSPFLTFVNAQDELYFTTVEAMATEKPPIAAYTLDPRTSFTNT